MEIITFEKDKNKDIMICGKCLYYTMNVLKVSILVLTHWLNMKHQLVIIIFMNVVKIKER